MTASSATQTTESQVSLKLMVSKETNRVLFAEAGKDFVDVLCSFLTLPLGTIARLLRKGSFTVGCFSSLYQSVEDLNREFLTTVLLQPRNSSEDYCRTLKLNIDDPEPKSCGNFMTLSVVLKEEGEYIYNGFVNGGVTNNYIITDNLMVAPNSVDQGFDLLTLHHMFGIQNTSSVKAVTVNVDKKKMLDLLICSLHSESALTDLFLGKKPLIQQQNFLFPCKFTDNSSSIQIKVKLFFRKSDGKVLYAQGGDDFLDFLLSFLTFPLGGVVRMLGGKCCLGSIDGLFKSIDDVDENKYFTSNEVKNRLVNPCIASQLKLGKHVPIPEQCATSYYCNGNPVFISDKSVGDYRTKLTLVDPKSSEGYVLKRPTAFIITDDLVISPMSLISAVSLLDRIGTPLSDLIGKVVTIGFYEGLSILKAALTSTSTLTNGLRHLLTEVKQEN